MYNPTKKSADILLGGVTNWQSTLYVYNMRLRGKTSISSICFYCYSLRMRGKCLCSPHPGTFQILTHWPFAEPHSHLVFGDHVELLGSHGWRAKGAPTGA